MRGSVLFILGLMCCCTSVYWSVIHGDGSLNFLWWLAAAGACFWMDLYLTLRPRRGSRAGRRCE